MAKVLVALYGADDMWRTVHELEAEGHEVVGTGELEGALDHYFKLHSTSPFDVVVISVHFNRAFAGYDFVRRLRKKGDQTPIILAQWSLGFNVPYTWEEERVKFIPLEEGGWVTRMIKEIETILR